MGKQQQQQLQRTIPTNALDPIVHIRTLRAMPIGYAPSRGVLFRHFLFEFEYMRDWHFPRRSIRRVLPEVQPGYLQPLIPDAAPVKPESWQDVMADIERVIMPGVTHWHSPRFHAYFPTANSYPAIVAVKSVAMG